jgi:hypothetical protein
MATSIIPPFAAFFMNILSFSLNEELPAAGVFCAAATPAEVSAAVVNARMHNFEITVILVFIAL